MIIMHEHTAPCKTKPENVGSLRTNLMVMQPDMLSCYRQKQAWGQSGWKVIGPYMGPEQEEVWWGPSGQKLI